jgi:hypothetical protein
MSDRPTARDVLGLTLTGMALGAFAGGAVLAVVLFVLGLRHGRVEFPLTWLGAALGALVGGLCGGILVPITAFTSWGTVPRGRLFAHLTIGTLVGGALVALLVPSPPIALLGGIVGFLVAGDRLAPRSAS